MSASSAAEAGKAPTVRCPIVTVYTTIGTEAEAKELARRLLDERLVACSNLLPMQSLYRWDGKVVEEAEVGMLLKSHDARLEALVRRLAEIHPYDVPCIEVYRVGDVAAPFQAWVEAETTDPGTLP